MRRFSIRRALRIPVARPGDAEREVDEELAFHVAMRAARLERDGLPATAAGDESRRRFGDMPAIREECLRIDEAQHRRARLADMIDAVAGDLRFALRTLRRAPAFVAASVLSLALAIGATVGTFMIVDGLLMRPQPWTRPAELYTLVTRFPRSGDVTPTWNAPQFAHLREAGAWIFSDVAAYARRSVTLAVPAADSGARVDAEFVSPSYLALVGVRAARGRAFDAAGATSDEVATALLSARLEHSLFGSASAVGRTVRVNGVSLTVVGTMADGFRGLSGSSDVWIPLAEAPTVWGNPDALSQYEWVLHAVVRVPPAWNAAKRLLALTNLRRAMGLDGIVTSDGGRAALQLVSAADALTDPGIRDLLWIVLAAACCVLVLACANVASLTIAKLTSRQTELAVRRALGASPARLAGSLLVEACVIAGAGTALGVAIAEWAGRVLWALRPVAGGPMAERLATARMPSVDGRLSAFVAAVALITVALLSLWPWLEVRRPLARGGLIGGGRAMNPSGKRERRVREGLSTIQLALAFVVTTSSVLLVSSYRTLTRTDNGFAQENVLTVRLDLPPTRYGGARAAHLYENLRDRLRLAPGVLAADVATSLPLDGAGSDGDVEVDSTLPRGKGGPGTSVTTNAVGPAYFRAFGIQAAGDVLDGPRAIAVGAGGVVPVVVSEAAAARFWPGRHAIGQLIAQVLVESGWRRATVVGVARDVQYGRAGAPPDPTIYVPYAASPGLRAAIVVRTAGSPLASLGLVRAALRGLDPELALYDARSMGARVSAASSVARFGALVLGAYAAVAFVIALIGVYSVIAFGVAQRRPELGVRMALGATPAMILSSVLRTGLGVTAAGLGAGVAGSVAAQRAIESRIAGLAGGSPGEYAAVLAAFALAGFAASVAPARSATRVDPAGTLRGGTSSG